MQIIITCKLVIINEIIRIYSVYLCISSQKQDIRGHKTIKKLVNLNYLQYTTKERTRVNLDHFKLNAITAASSFTAIFLDLLEL